IILRLKELFPNKLWIHLSCLKRNKKTKLQNIDSSMFWSFHRSSKMKCKRTERTHLDYICTRSFVYSLIFTFRLHISSIYNPPGTICSGGYTPVFEIVPLPSICATTETVFAVAFAIAVT